MISNLGAEMFETIFNYLLPENENEPVNNQSLTNFLQSTLNNETEKAPFPLYRNSRRSIARKR